MPGISIAVRYSYRGCERVWPCTLTVEDGGDGATDAARLKQGFAAEAEGASSLSSSTGARTQAHLRVVPARPGGPQLELSPVQGQGLAAFLEHSCREDNGIYQLRATFEAASGTGFVQVRVGFPGMVPRADASSGADPQMIVEEFECEKGARVLALKQMIEARTQFPAVRGVLLQGCRRLHDEQPLAKVAEAGIPLQFHVATTGAYVFLRREGQGHCVPSGPCTLTLQLPTCVQGARRRRMRFEPQQDLESLRRSVQAVSGLPPAVMHLELKAPVQRDLACEDRACSLQALGFTDSCTLEVQFDLTEESILGEPLELPLETPTCAQANELYRDAATKLGIDDHASLMLFAGSVAVYKNGSLSSVPLSDGTVLSAYIASPLQLSVSVLPWKSGAAFSGASASSAEPPAVPAALACWGSNTIAEVREQFCRERGGGASPALRSGLVFAVDGTEKADVVACRSLGELSRTLKHFSPCSDTSRLSRLGLTDGVHIVLVPDQRLLLLVEVRVFDTVIGERQLRVESKLQLRQLRRSLQQELHARPLEECPCIDEMNCQWLVLPSKGPEPTDQGGSARAGPAEPPSPARPAAQTFTAMVSNAIEVVKKRRSFGGARRESGAKRPKTYNLLPLGDDEFVGDLYARHPVPASELPQHFCCPISLDVMQDPVIVAGSGNTYDRKSIEQHFRVGHHTDPLSNARLRTATDRRLIANNSLKSQTREAQQSQIELRLIANFCKQKR